MTAADQVGSRGRAVPGGRQGRRRRSVRTRIMLVISALLVLTGAALLTLNYALISSRLRTQVARADARSEPVEPLPGERGPARLTEAPEVSAAPDGETVTVEAVEMRFLDTALREMLTQSALTLAVASVIAVAVGWALSRRILRPVRAITDAARQLSGHDLGARIALTGPDDELKELADTFDEMLERLDRAFTGERLFIANASHELRTPLSVARAAVDVYDAKADPTADDARSMTSKVRSAIGRSEDLIQRLLLLATAQHSDLHVQPVDLAALVADELDVLPRSSVAVRRSLRSAEVEGDPVLLALLVHNLVDNALNHNVEGGWIECSTTSVGGARLRVRNSGPVVPREHVQELFRPFRRGTNDRSARPGGGIGLAVVQAVAGRHGATIHASAPPEGGLDVLVRFDPAPQPAVGLAAGAQTTSR